MARFWNETRDNKLRKMLADGCSASEIASGIGGCTRNAVLGRVHRLGLASKYTRNGKRTLSVKAKLRVRKKAGKPFTFVTAPNMVRSPPMEPEPLPLPAADDKARISSIKLDIQHCRWPVGDPVTVGPHEPLFCGLDRKGPPGMPVSPYCDGHHARAYVPVRPRPPAFPMIAPVVQEEMEAA
jgi:GcrA cell cycle regulator